MTTHSFAALLFEAKCVATGSRRPRCASLCARLSTLALVAAVAAQAGAPAPNATLAAVAPGSVVDLGPLSCTTPVGEGDDFCQKITDYSGLQYDPGRHQLVLFGGGHAGTFTDSIVVFDIPTLTFRDLYLPTACSEMTLANLDAVKGAWIAGASGPYPRPFSTHSYDMLSIVGDELVMAATGTGGTSTGCPPVDSEAVNFPGKMAHFNLNTLTWRFTDAERFSAGFPGSERDPVSGLVVALGRDRGLEIYDPVAGTKTNPGPGLGDGAMGIEGALVYFPPTDTFLYFTDDASGTGVYELTLDRANLAGSNVTRLVTTGQSALSWRPFAYDSRNQIVGGGVVADTFYGFDPITRAWSAQPMTGANPGDAVFFALAYDPTDGVFLFLNDAGFSKHIFAYRFANTPDDTTPKPPTGLRIKTQ